eukprot:TRINITY_DN5101_c0_g3_i4.p1 TRINITY_DN5101_c0_g3~~TRINITY_DN5101_c0_g3_i4.p1  ORF type:complete len:205 (-),score=62.64 TRINITY_DN5101_c0_g3_i4:158-772(-)
MSSIIPDATLKIKMLGDSGVGKTSIINRYTEGTFTENTQATIGVDYKHANVKVRDKQVKLVIWDTAGQDKYRTLTSSYYKGAHAMCLVFSVSDRESFENLDKWRNEYNENAGESDSLLVLIANKIDLEDRVVAKEESVQYAKKNAMIYTEVSAKTAKGINDLFIEVANKVVEVNPGVFNASMQTRGTRLGPSAGAGEQSGGCCF